MRGTRNGARKPARIIAGGDRPGILGRIVIACHHHRLGREAERIGYDLRQYGAVALALRHARGMNGDRARRIEADCRARQRAVFRTSFFPLLRRQQSGDVPHVRDRRLDHHRKADAIEAVLRPRGGAPGLKLGEPAFLLSARDRRGIVS